MKLSTKGRYAVMAMVDLARHAQAKPVSLSDIAARQEISLSYLEQLFARLRRAGLVKSVRGPGGGYLLAHAEDQTRISDIIIAVDDTEILDAAHLKNYLIERTTPGQRVAVKVRRIDADLTFTVTLGGG